MYYIGSPRKPPTPPYFPAEGFCLIRRSARRGACPVRGALHISSAASGAVVVFSSGRLTALLSRGYVPRGLTAAFPPYSARVSAACAGFRAASAALFLCSRTSVPHAFFLFFPPRHDGVTAPCCHGACEASAGAFCRRKAALCSFCRMRGRGWGSDAQTEAAAGGSRTTVFTAGRLSASCGMPRPGECRTFLHFLLKTTACGGRFRNMPPFVVFRLRKRATGCVRMRLSLRYIRGNGGGFLRNFLHRGLSFLGKFIIASR